MDMLSILEEDSLKNSPKIDHSDNSKLFIKPEVVSSPPIKLEEKDDIPIGLRNALELIQLKEELLVPNTQELDEDPLIVAYESLCLHNVNMATKHFISYVKDCQIKVMEEHAKLQKDSTEIMQTIDEKRKESKLTRTKIFLANEDDDEDDGNNEIIDSHKLISEIIKLKNKEDIYEKLNEKIKPYNDIVQLGHHTTEELNNEAKKLEIKIKELENKLNKAVKSQLNISTSSP